MEAIEEVGGLDALKEDADLAVDTINAYTRRVKGTWFILFSLSELSLCRTDI